jgi:pSer/pThr/pTyr-binding forkhead associated (FHA) protein
MKAGDYVRTKDYGFIKVKSFYYNEDMIHILDENNDDYDFSKELVEDFKSSPNIIDLIEVGDYVNGEKVIRLFNPMFLSMGELPYAITDKSKYEPQEIKSIVTKEMYSSMEYKIGE